jgi:glycosyltransferase involved in cell wall biosynthesis
VCSATGGGANGALDTTGRRNAAPGTICCPSGKRISPRSGDDGSILHMNASAKDVGDSAAGRTRPLVSIITPTHQRAAFLPEIRRCVEAQTYPNIEWLILDDSPEPCAAFAPGAANDRVRYLYSAQRMTTGEKRNRLVTAARGTFVAHFDDDDYYAPTYLESMISLLESQGADFVNLGSWYLYDFRYDFFGFWNLRQTTGLHYLLFNNSVRLINFTSENNAVLAGNHLGYGFSYVYRRTLWEAHPFPLLNFREDAEFVRAAAAGGLQLLSLEDRHELALHVLHAKSTSSSFPQFRLPSFLLATLFPGYRRAVFDATIAGWSSAADRSQPGSDTGQGEAMPPVDHVADQGL